MTFSVYPWWVSCRSPWESPQSIRRCVLEWGLWDSEVTGGEGTGRITVIADASPPHSWAGAVPCAPQVTQLGEHRGPPDYLLITKAIKSKIDSRGDVLPGSASSQCNFLAD